MNDRDGRSQSSTPEPEARFLARSYMLGDLPPQQQDEVERRFLFDTAFEDVVLEEETDLFDELAAGTLSSEQERALRLWASSQQRTQSRLEAAFIFNRLTSNTTRDSVSNVPTVRNWLGSIRAHRISAMWLAGVAVVCLSLSIATPWVTRRRSMTETASSATTPRPSPIARTGTPFPAREPEAPLPHAPVVAADPAPARSVVTLFLMAEETRGSSEAAQLRLKPGTSRVTLQLASRAGLVASQRAVQLEDAEGSAVQPRGVHLRRLNGQNFLEVTLDATALRHGKYTVLLNQEPATGVSPALTYHFQIVDP